MDLPGHDAVRLTVHLGEAQRHDGRPAFEALVRAAREAGLAGATVLRGPMGYGQSGLHTSSVLALSRDLPVIVVMVDTAEKIEAFLPTVDAVVEKGLVTTEPVRIIRNGARAAG
jgi:PII-like signaling protein